MTVSLITNSELIETKLDRVASKEAMPNIDTISRRNLIKLMTVASATMFRPMALLADVVAPPTANAGNETVALTNHPRLYYHAASLERLRQILAKDTVTYAGLKKSGEEMLAAKFIPEKIAMQGPGQHASYGEPGTQMSDLGLTLGLLYQLTEDTRYADKLRDALLYYANYVRWTGPNFGRRSPAWHSELDTAKFIFGYANGYDALHAYLSVEDRKTIADAMVRLAILPTLNDWVLPGTRIHSFDTMGHNWWGVCVAGAGIGALALLGDDTRAQGWIDAIDAGFEQWFNYRGNVLQNRSATFERSGPSYEGVNYTKYGVTEYLHYRLAWQNTYPGRKAAAMEPLNGLARFFLQTLYPTATGSFSVNFNDSGLESDATETMLFLIACGIGTPEASRYLELVQPNSEGPFISLLRSYPKPVALQDVPNSCIYPEMGWAMLRSSWEKNATFLAMKSGYTWNHAHADAGSFILFQQGQPLIIDSGTCPYGRKEYQAYYCQSQAHNVILFEGTGQPKDDLHFGCKFPGRLHCLVDGLDLKYVYADATGPMARFFSRNYRHWIWSGDILLIVDDVVAHTAGQLDWLLHYMGDYKTDHEGSVHLKNGAAEATFKMLYPAVKQREDIGLAAHNPDKKIPYLVFSSQVPLQTGQFVAAICLNSATAPKFEIQVEENYLRVRMQTRDTVEELYLNLRAFGSPDTLDLQVDDWVTDAYLLHLKRPLADDKTVARFFVSDGSYLRYQGRSVMESLTKLTACWASMDDALEIFSDSESTTVEIAAAHSPTRVTWNNRVVTARYDDQLNLVSVRV